MAGLASSWESSLRVGRCDGVVTGSLGPRLSLLRLGWHSKMLCGFRGESLLFEVSKDSLFRYAIFPTTVHADPRSPVISVINQIGGFASSNFEPSVSFSLRQCPCQNSENLGASWCVTLLPGLLGWLRRLPLFFIFLSPSS